MVLRPGEKDTRVQVDLLDRAVPKSSGTLELTFYESLKFCLPELYLVDSVLPVIKERFLKISTQNGT